MIKQYLECGKIVTTHGIRGEIKVEPWCDTPDYLCGFDRLYLDKNGGSPLDVDGARVNKNMVLLKIRGVDDIDGAVKLRGKILYMNRDDAPEDGGVFIQDLLGLPVRDADTDKLYGTLKDVFPTGANDVYVINSGSGKDYLVPVIPDVVVSRNPEDGYILIRPLKGLFDDAD